MLVVAPPIDSERYAGIAHAQIERHIEPHLNDVVQIQSPLFPRRWGVSTPQLHRFWSEPIRKAMGQNKELSPELARLEHLGQPPTLQALADSFDR